MTKTQHRQTSTTASGSQGQGEEDDDDTKMSTVAQTTVDTGQLCSSSKLGTGEDEDEEGEPTDDNAESSSASSSGGQGSNEGYTADCSSDASSDLSGSAKKKAKDNMILSVKNLSVKDNQDKGKDSKLKEGDSGADDTAARNEKKKSKKKKKKIKEERSSDGDSDMADVEDEGNLAAQWNGVQVVHPMDPRIDISRVGYLHLSPVGVGREGANQTNQKGDQSAINASNQEEAPSLENYVQLMEVVRPFFDSHGLGATQAGMPIGDPLAIKAPTAAAPVARRPRTAYGLSAGDSRTSTSLTGTRSTSSQSSSSARRRDAPLHLFQEATNKKAPLVPLQLAARQKPLAAAAAAEFYAPDDDPADEDDSDTSSMVVLARTKKKHKQQSGASETASEQRSVDAESAARSHHHHHHHAVGVDMQVDAENAEDDRKPAARPQVPLQEDVGNQHAHAHLEHAPAAEDEAGQGNASSSSSGGDQRLQAVANQPRHNYDVAHVVTESASNTNTTTSGSGSGSGGNSGSNQGSSGSGNGSSGSGNGSSGSGNEGKGSSEDVGAKEENIGEGNSNSEDVNSDDRKPDDEKEIAHPLAARRHAAGLTADGGVNDPMQLDAPGPLAPSDQKRKLQDKKRKRMNMRREYEEKVQQEMESSESSAAHNAITLRPGKPVTLDKVLSFTKVARMVIQAGPPFLVVHTNAAYTRLTGIDAHAAVGKPVSALLSVQGPERLSMNANEGAQPADVVMAPPAVAAAPNVQNGVMGPPRQNLVGAFEVATIAGANLNNGRRLGQSLAEAEEAGRARAAQAVQNDSGNINLERLVAACGFGKYHVLHARSRPHQMVGRNVTFVNKAGTAAGLPPSGTAVNGMRKQDDSSDTSLTTSHFDGALEPLKCRSSISPIISDQIDSAVVTDTNQEPHGHKNKRRKYHHHNNVDAHHHRRFPGKDSAIPRRYQQCITHYAIQLEIFDASKQLEDSGSSGSTSVEANLLGLTKEELRRQRETAHAGERGTSQEESAEQQRQQEDDDEMASETTEGTVPVTAVG